MILQAVLLLAGLSLASGNICCSPRQFNSFQHVTYANSTTTFRALYYIIYDGVNERYLVTGDRSNNKFVTTTKVIYDYRKRQAYSIDAAAKTCTVYSIQGQFEDQQNVCIPSDARSLGSLFYGYNAHRLSGQSYIYNTTVNGRDQSIVTTVTEDCVPIVVTRTTTGGPGGNSLYVVGYNEFYPGIRDITVFDIPPYC